jgi:translation initiation factor 2B subunit (eIF-2B alpha/beta/delta family)
MRNQTTTTTATVGGGSELTLHPEIVRLGLMYANRLITGANARCVAMLHAFRKVFLLLSLPKIFLSFSLSFSLSLSHSSFSSQCVPLSLSLSFFLSLSLSLSSFSSKSVSFSFSLSFLRFHSLIFCIRFHVILFQMIEDYKSHPQKPLALDLDSKLKPSIQYLADCRSLSLGMRNVIKHLRVQIGKTTQMNEEQVLFCLLFTSFIFFSHSITQSHNHIKYHNITFSHTQFFSLVFVF